ncbi:dynamin family protein [Microlunatus endophyticus]
MIRAALYVARSRADDSVERHARALLARLAEDRLRLAVAGQFSRGKTTLMNAILGAEYLPTGALPMTSVVTTVTYGSAARATVRRRDAALPIDVPLDELADYVARSGSRRSVLEVVSADVEVPANLLRLGFAFVDTPGVGSEDELSTATTRQYLPQADAAVFVTGFDSPLTATELSFVSELQQRVGRLFVVINKRDLVSSDQVAEVESYVSERLAERDVSGQSVHSVSALKALQARTAGDHQMLAESGLPALEKDLLGFLTREKAQLLLDRAAQRAEELVADLQRDLRLGELGSDVETANEITHRVETEVAGLRAQVADTVVRLDQTASQALSRLLRARRASWRAELHSELSRTTDDMIRIVDEGSPEGREGSDVSSADIATLLTRSTQPTYEAWWNKHVAATREALTTAAAELIGDLTGTDGAVVAMGRRAAELSGDRPSDDQGWSVADVPCFSIAPATWTIPVDFGRRARRRGPTTEEFQAATATGIELASDRALAELHDRLVAAIPRWVERFADVARHDVDQAVTRFRHQLTVPPSDTDRQAVADLATGLPTFRTGLRDLVDDTSPVAVEAVDPRGAMPSPATTRQLPTNGALTCVICSRLQRALSEVLSHEQFRLATMQRAQAEHASEGGFCRLHTWEYAAMASPVGISAGYARLAETLAAALDEVAAQRPASLDVPTTGREFAPDLARAVGEQVTRTDSCRVCIELARVEAEQAAIVAHSPNPVQEAAMTGGDRTPVLCLHHLAAVLAARPDTHRARTLTRALAAQLHRASEDMRSFVLAREAIRRGLITTEENKAYEDVLRLIAGLPALARPWKQSED